MDRTAETDRLLEKTVRERKSGHRFVKFVEELTEKPTGESLKIMSSILERPLTEQSERSGFIP